MTADPKHARRAQILVVRGGAIGDFILTLPAIKLLRDGFPAAWLEVLGYPHIASLAVSVGLVDAVRALESGALARFFVDPKRAPELEAAWCAWFAGFGQVVSYLYDPDGFFAANLRRAGVRNFLAGPGKIDPALGVHATRQLARPLERLGLFLENENAARPLAPGADEQAFAADFLRDLPPAATWIALHPGSGAERKNWPADRWLHVARRLLETPDPRTGRPSRLLLVGGEADGAALAVLIAGVPADRVALARDLPLPRLAGLLARCRLFLGHDSGISHLAAVVGCPCVLLFGPTNPAVWAPLHPHVRVVRGPSGGCLLDLSVDAVAGIVVNA